jgi:hypothetical protein
MGRPLNIDRLGGDTTQTGLQLQVKAKVSSIVAVGNCSVIQQKNQYSFRCMNGTGIKHICRLVDKTIGNVLLGEMTITATPAAGPAFRIKKVTNRFCWDFNNNRFRWTFGAASGSGHDSFVTLPSA